MATNRRRLGVAVIPDRPLADELDGLRRAVGDPSLARIPPHVTLVPPVNVHAADMPEALGRLRRAAASLPGPLRLTLGSVSTFLPVNPVLYLAVGGDVEALRTLRDAVFAPPLARRLSWPWVPHLTLADGGTEERITAGTTALADYAVLADIDRVVLLEEGPGRVWRPVADAALGRPVRVGTGGLALEMTAGRILDPELAAVSCGDGPVGPEWDTRSMVLTARRGGRPVGQGVAWLDRSGPHLAVWVDPEHRRQGIGGHVLAHLELMARRAGWAHPAVQAHGPAGFYRALSRWSVPTGDTGGTPGV